VAEDTEDQSPDFTSHETMAMEALDAWVNYQRSENDLTYMLLRGLDLYMELRESIADVDEEDDDN
jgi:hypothetical protein